MPESIYRNLPKKFESVVELVQNDVFISYVSQNISQVIKQRGLRPDPRPGYKYKKDWIDKMLSDGTLNTEFFLQHLESVWTKTSGLTSNERQGIDEICRSAYYQTLDVYKAKAEMDAAENSEKPTDKEDE